MKAATAIRAVLTLVLLGPHAVCQYAWSMPRPFRVVPFRVVPFRVVIDPGHGGADEGAVFDNGRLRVAEKDITLLLARQVAHRLAAKGIHVALTRANDRDVALGDRTALANRVHADVFLSIHMNSAATRPPTRFGDRSEADEPEGIETYFLNDATDATSRRLAHLENSIFPKSQGIYNPQQMDVALILKDLRLDANLSESKRLACTIQQSLLKGRTGRNRGVKQALFHVLLGADMPSVLVEAGFINSARDRAVALSPRGQGLLADSITRAIVRYRQGRGRPEGISVLNSCQVR